MEKEREFPNWEQLYQEKEVENMPWFNPDLDPDLAQALTQLKLQSGKFLDLGTGPGTQAMALAERGFEVTAIDLSDTAVKKAEAKAKEKGLDIIWKQDDFFHSKLTERFNFIFDRGCFHTFAPHQRKDYILVINQLIESQGYLFLKCFSHKEMREQGPYRFTPVQIKEIFSDSFQICDIKETIYHGTATPSPQALFCILQKLNVTT